MPGELNESQKRRLSVTCEYVDRLLGEIEHIVHSAGSASPFPRYIVDITPEQAGVLEEGIQRLRVELVRALAWQKMAPAAANIPATRAVLTNLHFIDIALEELRPRYLRGSGPVPEDLIDDLNAIIVSLRVRAEEIVHFLLRETAEKDRQGGSSTNL